MNFTNRFNDIVAIVTIGMGCAVISTPAYSQQAEVSQDSNTPSTDSSVPDPDERILDEVVVTAERFEANVQTTPVAVTAISGEVLADRQITNVLEAAEAIPGVMMENVLGTNKNARIVMRGAGAEQSGINFDPAVGIYIDNVYQPRINGAFFDFFDIAQLVVLRGPQGTLYGRNTSGGAIKIETKRPSFDWTWGAEGNLGSYDLRAGKIYVSGPLVENKLAFSFSGVMKQQDGYLYGVAYDRRVGNIDRKAGRVKLLFTPMENLDLVLSVFDIEDDSESVPGIPLSLFPGVVDPYVTGSQDRDLTITESFGNFGENGSYGDNFLDNTGASLNVTYTVSDALEVNLISGWGDQRTFSNGGPSFFITPASQAALQNGTLAPPGQNEGRGESEFFSQEATAIYTTERLKAVAGLFYFHEDGMSRALTLNAPTTDQDRVTKANAVFAQGTYTIGRGVSLTAGLRYTKETADFTQFFRTQNNAAQSDSKTFKDTTPKLGVSWEITPDVFAYASWTQGFKSGGFNPVPPNADTGVEGEIGAPTPYGPEKVDSYEMGLKFTTDENRFRLNIAAFQADFSGLQLPVFFPGTTTSYTSNASDAIVRGIELEPTWQVLDTLQLYGNLALTDGKYTKSFVCSNQYGVFEDCSDRDLKGVIPESGLLGFRYSPNLPIPGELTFGGSWKHHSKFFNNTANEGPLVQTYAANIFKASIDWTDEEGRWKVALEGSNLTDEHYILHAIQIARPLASGGPVVTGYPNPPRQVTLRVGLSF